MLNLIPDHGVFDMPSLFETLLVQKFKTCVFPLREEWIDIGSIEALSAARKRFSDQQDLVSLPGFDFSIKDDRSTNFGRIVPQIFGPHKV
jgi:NDP-sugar pyrophosphorylase family protein